jgi:hypothetical protein
MSRPLLNFELGATASRLMAARNGNQQPIGSLLRLNNQVRRTRSGVTEKETYRNDVRQEIQDAAGQTSLYCVRWKSLAKLERLESCDSPAPLARLSGVFR